MSALLIVVVVLLLLLLLLFHLPFNVAIGKLAPK
jgi:hypothetical protein